MKSILLISFLIIYTISLRGQIINNYGVKFGIGISNHSWQYEEGYELNFDNKIGISPRIYADFFNYQFFQIQGEIGFLRKGFSEQIPITTMMQPDGTGEFINTDIGLDYLLLTTLVKIKYEIGIFSPYIILGPQIDFLINKKVEKGWELIYDRFSNANIDFSIGVGNEIKNILPISILFEYRYERDFMDNYDHPNVNIKNYSHVILIGIKI